MDVQEQGPCLCVLVFVYVCTSCVQVSGISSIVILTVWLNICPQMTPKRTASVQTGTSMELTP